jgi:hypothetical protein
MDNENVNSASDINQIQEETTQQIQERLFKQSELNEIVGRAKHEAVESFKRQQQSTQTQPPIQSGQTSNYRSLSEDDVKRLTSEELSRQLDQRTREVQEKADAELAQRIVNSYKEKIAPGKEKYEDFEAVTNNVDMRYYPNVVQLLAEYVDNSHDVIYELAKNRTKLYQLESACGHNPQDAIYEIKRLSDSIKANESTSNIKYPHQPLSQQRPSNTGTDSGNSLSMKDLKLKYKG